MTELETLRHSAAHILATALLELWPEAQLAAGPPVENGFYYDVSLSHRISPEDFPKIEEKMREIVRAGQPFVCVPTSREEAEKLALRGRLGALSERPVPSEFKLDILRGIPEGEPITLYQNGEFLDLCAGPHVKSTALVRAVRLTHVASAYYRGDEKNPQLQRIYGTAFPSERELAEHLARLEEAKKRDHRKLGRELELFYFDEAVGAGLPLWLPRGAVIRQELQAFLGELLAKQGYETVFTPHIGELGLYRTSGHFPYYRESQYPPIPEPAVWESLVHEGCRCGDYANRLESGVVGGYLLKPMNCPMHARIFASRPRSYRELPVRLAEFGTVYRWEKSGELGGMTRLRGFTQDDAHIFCSESQVEAEVAGCLELVRTVLATLDLRDCRIRLGLRGPDSGKYIGEPALWEKAEAALCSAIRQAGLEFTREAGEAAFYGPKIDFLVRDCLGREWQLGTVQLDYNLPIRFGLAFVGADNREHRPVMIHRAPFGSLERFLAILIEHFGGDFPVWLAPEQVRILPISDQQLDYAREVAAALRKRRLRVSVDEKHETLNAKIRIAESQKIPYMAIVGKNEQSSKNLSVRSRRRGNLGVMALTVFADQLVDEVIRRSL
ncbi:threonyl-tRNA synthetase [Methylacidimicrobium cyclopophantes]|uniref:Threonine--tRNA ligase n=1 Tax=Methylacidimicrobium cyclopophantes TaxID=1041766 RepID=A0A5E6MJJ1_9BACT|nr:threonine--tRNA ligase [Methylacidimicrobium cyclopophantes]VVM05682.1 threonyl-tRNA synthetase [Methylacidimicrobium cyclopophantes]